MSAIRFEKLENHIFKLENTIFWGKMSSTILIIPIVISLIEGTSLIDVGCGLGKYGLLTKIYKEKVKLQVGCDAFLPYLEFCKEHKLYHDIICCDASYLPFRPKSCSTLIMIDTIEHLTKSKGRIAIKYAEKIAKERIILTTPNKASKRHGVLTEYGYNPFEAHVSSWTVKEFKALGFKIYGVGFRLDKLPPRLFGKINTIFAYTFIPFPSVCSYLIVWKKIHRCSDRL